MSKTWAGFVSLELTDMNTRIKYQTSLVWHKGQFRQGSKDQKPRDQFEVSWTLNWTLLHIFTLFLMVQWVCPKAWGPIWGSNIPNVWLACERIRLTFGILFFFFFSFIFIFIFYFFFFLTFTTHNGWELI